MVLSNKLPLNVRAEQNWNLDSYGGGGVDTLINQNVLTFVEAERWLIPALKIIWSEMYPSVFDFSFQSTKAQRNDDWVCLPGYCCQGSQREGREGGREIGVK